MRPKSLKKTSERTVIFFVWANVFPLYSATDFTVCLPAESLST